jgi:crotonobetainyl-CoA:carnitine CoA-transferase CaiB-like acyl-CoA transferase
MELSPRAKYKKDIPPEELEVVSYDFDQLSPAEKALVMKARRGEDLTEEEEDALPYETFCRYTFHRKRVYKKDKPLDGVRVIDFTTLILGPSHCAMLAEMGAEVIKLELPGRGDTMRALAPPQSMGGFPMWSEEKTGTKAPGILGKGVTAEKDVAMAGGLGWTDCAKNKLHACMDIHPGEGGFIFKELCKQADIFIENVRGGTLDRWDEGYRQLRELNPGLIYLTSNGPGQWGREDLVRASYDILAQSMGGSVFISGHDPGDQMKIPIWVADYMGGTFGLFATLVALYAREKYGVGQMIENSQVENITRALGPGVVWYSLTGHVQTRWGNRFRWICPDCIVKAKDGFIAIGADDEAFKALCNTIGGKATAFPAKYPTNMERVRLEAQEEIYEAIETWAAKNTVAEIDSLGRKHGFGVCPVMNAKDACTRQHYRERGEIEYIEDPWYGPMDIQGCFPLFSESPSYTEFGGKPIGWDTEYVLRRFLGYDTEKILQLEKTHEIGKIAGAEGRRTAWPVKPKE